MMIPALSGIISGRDRAAAASLAMESYQFYANADGVQPGSAIVPVENRVRAATPNTTPFRLRVAIKNIGDATQTSGSKTFKLQYASAGQGYGHSLGSEIAPGAWTDVGAAGSGSIWRFVNNATPTDGAVIASTLLSTTTVLGNYVESGATPALPSDLTASASIEYDFAIEANAAPLASYYVFRVVESDGTLLSSGYINYPKLATINDLANQEQHQWLHVDEAGVPTALEDKVKLGIVTNDIARVRIMHKDGGDFISGALVQLVYYTSYTDLAADTNGTEVVAPGAGGADWEWYDDGTSNWYAHSNRIPTVETSDHGPEAGNCFEHTVVQGDEWLSDWTAVGTSAGPEHNFSLKYTGVAATGTKYYLRIKLDGSMLPLSNMHYGSNRDAIFETA